MTYKSVVKKGDTARCPYCNTIIGEVERGPHVLSVKEFGGKEVDRVQLGEDQELVRLLAGYSLSDGIWRMINFARQRLLDGRRRPGFRGGGEAMAPVPPALIECWRCSELSIIQVA